MSSCIMCGEEIKKTIEVVDSDGLKYGAEFCLRHARLVYGKQLELPNYSKIPYK